MAHEISPGFAEADVVYSAETLQRREKNQPQQTPDGAKSRDEWRKKISNLKECGRKFFLTPDQIKSSSAVSSKWKVQLRIAILQ